MEKMVKTLANGLQQKYMGLNPDGTENWQYVHRLKAGAKPGDGKVIHHKDGNNKNNSASNLQKTDMAGHNRIDPKHRLGGRKKK
jgi:hypothetical protein